jgi:hypothetical protein
MAVDTAKRNAAQLNEADVEDAIAALAKLDHAALKERWRALQGTDPPKRLSRQLLLRALAHVVQERAFGGLSPAIRQRLQRLGEELRATGRIASIGSQPLIKPGTRLVREWRGNTHEITVLEDAYQWNGEKYRSLSAIARAITGTRWNGHTFFGLKSRPSASSPICSTASQGGTGGCKARSAKHRRNDGHG